MQKPFRFTKNWEYSFYVFLLAATEQPLTIYSTSFYYFIEDIKLVTDFSLNYRERDSDFILFERFLLY